MIHILRKYLFLYKKLNLPGIGTFFVEDIPARLDFSTKRLHAPIPVIRFSLEKIATDKQLFDFLSSELSQPGVEAVRSFTDYIHHLRVELSNNNIIDLPNIGQLKKEFANTYSFQPANLVNEYFPQVAAHRITHDWSATHNIKLPVEEGEAVQEEDVITSPLHKRKDYWWVYAIGLAIIGAGALLYYYYFKK